MNMVKILLISQKSCDMSEVGRGLISGGGGSKNSTPHPVLRCFCNSFCVDLQLESSTTNKKLHFTTVLFSLIKICHDLPKMHWKGNSLIVNHIRTYLPTKETALGIQIYILPTAYIVRREGYVLTRVCLSVHRGVPRSAPAGGGGVVLLAGGYPLPAGWGYPLSKAGWGYPMYPFS